MRNEKKIGDIIEVKMIEKKIEKKKQIIYYL